MSEKVDITSTPSEQRGSIRSVDGDEKSPATGPPETEPSTVLSGKKLAVVFIALMLSLFLVMLDQTILATALPQIASDFDAFTLQGWVATSYMAQSVFLLFYGQVLRIFPAKWVLVCAIATFEIGSLLCGVSQNIGQLIAGRVVAGVGAAGIMVSMMQVITQATRLEDRPKFYGAFGALFAISSVVGPPIGGAFSDNVTWRWCFWINLPLGGVSICGVSLLLKAAPPLGSDPTRRSARDRFHQALRLDFVGAALAAGALISLILALQWGGNTKSWGNKGVIISFVFSAILTLVFIGWSRYLGDRAMMPTTIFKSRSIHAILIFCFLNRFSMFIFTYYIPLFYQAARAHSATKSGVDFLPFMIGVVITAAFAGGIVAKTGYYWPVLLVAPCFLATGSGLFYTINDNTSSATLVGFQILAAVGLGMGFQNAALALQVEFNDDKKLLAQAIAMGAFAQQLGGTVGLGVAEPIFASELAKNLRKFAPDAPALIVEQTPTAIYSAIPKEMIPGVVLSYNDAIRTLFLAGVPIACMGLIAVLFIKNIRIKKTAEGIVPANAAGGKESVEDAEV
ncbi:major facilitator superfamily domain-containing protein [Mycena alexandri]|uniref:Major facilitator superfamily domain-containing protein n=1 Tax=Mycena alexandri TaxID=1745969 RepID=A0AAD6TAN4_9AGAR|nr:major facilitator superfamily domain-containing protein [Mycena alexandri]